MKGKKCTNQERRERLKTCEIERRKVFKELCQHVSNGFSIDCFAVLAIETIQKYMQEYPREFIQEQLNEAIRKGKDMWEGIGYRQANGQCLGNSRSWYYNMANRYGWREKIDIEAEHKGSMQVNIVNYASKKQVTKQ